jgi:hypothetical protein
MGAPFSVQKNAYGRTPPLAIARNVVALPTLREVPFAGGARTTDGRGATLALMVEEFAPTPNASRTWTSSGITPGLVTLSVKVAPQLEEPPVAVPFTNH